MILGVHRPALAVPDVQQALEFYCGVTGVEIVMNIDLPSGFESMSVERRPIRPGAASLRRWA